MEPPVQTFIVIARFLPQTDMTEIRAHIPAERAQVAILKEAGRLGTVHLAMPRGTVFLEVFAEDAAAATVTVQTLPMARYWELDVYPIVAPQP